MVGKVMGKDVWRCHRIGEAKTGSIPARGRRNEWGRKKPRGIKGTDRCLDEDEGEEIR
jgi:hypothetical protein